MPLQDDDRFLVERGGQSFYVPSSGIPAMLNDNDLLLVNRDGVSYTISGAELESNFQLVDPPTLLTPASGASGIDPSSVTLTCTPIDGLNDPVWQSTQWQVTNGSGTIDWTSSIVDYTDSVNSPGTSFTLPTVVPESSSIQNDIAGSGTAANPYTFTVANTNQLGLFSAGMNVRASLTGLAGVSSVGMQPFQNAFIWQQIDSPLTAYTLSFWVKFTGGLGTQPKYILKQETGGTAYYLAIKENALQISDGASTSNFGWGTTGPNSDTQIYSWNHFVIELNGSNGIEMWINGTKVSGTDTTAGNALPSGLYQMGGYAASYENDLGIISEFYFLEGHTDLDNPATLFGAVNDDSQWAPLPPSQIATNIATDTAGYGDNGFYFGFRNNDSAENWVWSTNNEFEAAYPCENAFNNNPDSYCRNNNNVMASMRFPSDLYLSGITSLSITGAVDSNTGEIELETSEGTYVSITNLFTAGSAALETITTTSIPSLVGFRLNNGGANAQPRIAEIRVTTATLNDVRLTRHTAVGTDYSGNSNHGYDENFAVGNTSQPWSTRVKTDDQPSINNSFPPQTVFNGSIYDTGTFALYPNYGDQTVFEFNPAITGVQVLKVYGISTGDVSNLLKFNGTSYGSEVSGKDNQWVTTSFTGTLETIEVGSVALGQNYALACIEINGQRLVDPLQFAISLDNPISKYEMLGFRRQAESGVVPNIAVQDSGLVFRSVGTTADNWYSTSTTNTLSLTGTDDVYVEVQLWTKNDNQYLAQGWYNQATPQPDITGSSCTQAAVYSSNGTVYINQSATGTSINTPQRSSNVIAMFTDKANDKVGFLSMNQYNGASTSTVNRDQIWSIRGTKPEDLNLASGWAVVFQADDSADPSNGVYNTVDSGTDTLGPVPTMSIGQSNAISGAVEVYQTGTGGTGNQALVINGSLITMDVDGQETGWQTVPGVTEFYSIGLRNNGTNWVTIGGVRVGGVILQDQYSQVNSFIVDIGAGEDLNNYVNALSWYSGTGSNWVQGLVNYGQRPFMFATNNNDGTITFGGRTYKGQFEGDVSTGSVAGTLTADPNLVTRQCSVEATDDWTGAVGSNMVGTATTGLQKDSTYAARCRQTSTNNSTSEWSNINVWETEVSPPPGPTAIYSWRLNRQWQGSLCLRAKSPGNLADFCLSLWFKSSNGEITGYQYILSQSASSYIALDPSSNTFWVSYSSGNAFTFPSVTENEWHHLFIKNTSADGGKTTVYLDGNASSEGELTTGFVLALANPYLIGWYSGNFGFDGYMSEFYLVEQNSMSPSDFGQTVNGTWVPKTPSDVAASITSAGGYGSNGVYYDFNPANPYFDYFTACFPASAPIDTPSNRGVIPTGPGLKLSGSSGPYSAAPSAFDGSLRNKIENKGGMQCLFEFLPGNDGNGLAFENFCICSDTVVDVVGVLSDGTALSVKSGAGQDTWVTLTGNSPGIMKALYWERNDDKSYDAGLYGLSVDGGVTSLKNTTAMGYDKSGNNNHACGQNVAVGNNSALFSNFVTSPAPQNILQKAFNGSNFGNQSQAVQVGPFVIDNLNSLEQKLTGGFYMLVGASCSVTFNGVDRDATSDANAKAPYIVNFSDNTLTIDRIAVTIAAGATTTYGIVVNGQTLINKNLVDNVFDKPTTPYTTFKREVGAGMYQGNLVGQGSNTNSLSYATLTDGLDSDTGVYYFEFNIKQGSTLGSQTLNFYGGDSVLSGSGITNAQTFTMSTNAGWGDVFSVIIDTSTSNLSAKIFKNRNTEYVFTQNGSIPVAPYNVAYGFYGTGPALVNLNSGSQPFAYATNNGDGTCEFKGETYRTCQQQPGFVGRGLLRYYDENRGVPLSSEELTRGYGYPDQADISKGIYPLNAPVSRNISIREFAKSGNVYYAVVDYDDSYFTVRNNLINTATEWEPTTVYRKHTLVLHEDCIYVVNRLFTSGATFSDSPEDLTEVLKACY